MSTEEIKNKLQSLERQINEAKTTVANLEGREEELLKRLKEEFKVKSLPEAVKLLSKLEEEIATKEKTIKDKFAELQAQYEW